MIMMPIMTLALVEFTCVRSTRKEAAGAGPIVTLEIILFTVLPLDLNRKLLRSAWLLKTPILWRHQI